MLNKEDPMVAETSVARKEPSTEEAIDKSASRLKTIDQSVNETIEITSPMVEDTHLQTETDVPLKERSASFLDSLHSSLAAARSSTAEQVSCYYYYYY